MASRFSSGTPVEAVEADSTVRIDRWLSAIRLYKSRSLAAEACDGGKVKVNGNNAKPHKLVRVSDEVSVNHPAGRKEFKVLALAEKRGPASEARLLYEDNSPPPPPREEQGFFVPPQFRPHGMRRPTKRERRQIERVKGRG